MFFSCFIFHRDEAFHVIVRVFTVWQVGRGTFGDRQTLTDQDLAQTFAVYLDDRVVPTRARAAATDPRGALQSD